MSAASAKSRLKTGLQDKILPHQGSLLLPLILYVVMPIRNFYWDGVAFAIDIEKQPPIASLVHPSHLLYAVWGEWLYRLTGALGLHVRALYVLQAANGILAGCCVMLVYRLLGSRRVAVAGALLFGFSATWWRFAADANAYVPSIFCLLCAALLLEGQRPILAGLAQAGAMLFHELAILFLPVAWMRVRKDRQAMASYSTSALLPVAIAYACAYKAVSRNPTIAGWFGWMTAHSPDSGFSFRFASDAILTVRGTFRLFFGGKFDDFVGGPLSIAACVALLAACLGFLVCLWRTRRSLTASSIQPAPWLLVWVAVYVAFLFFWMPQNTFYRLFYLPPLIMLLILPWRCTRWLVAVVALWNFVFLAYPQSRWEFNVPLRFAVAQRERWAPGTPIVFHRFHPDLWTISYFNQQAAWITLEQVDLGQLERDLDYARREGKPLWLEATAYDLVASDAAGRQWLSAHERPGELVEFRDTKHRFAFYCMR